MSSNLKITIFTFIVMMVVTLISLMTTDTEKKVETNKAHNIEVDAPKTDSNKSQILK